MANQLIDALGIPLSECHRWLPDRVALWPTPKKLVDRKAAACWRRSWFQCWYCGVITDAGETSPRRGEVHHMARHDAPWAFAWLCADCHRHTEAAVRASSLYRLLTLKHKFDLEHCSWLHLAIGLGRRLPTAEGE